MRLGICIEILFILSPVFFVSALAYYFGIWMITFFLYIFEAYCLIILLDPKSVQDIEVNYCAGITVCVIMAIFPVSFAYIIGLDLWNNVKLDILLPSIGIEDRSTKIAAIVIYLIIFVLNIIAICYFIHKINQ